MYYTNIGLATCRGAIHLHYPSGPGSNSVSVRQPHCAWVQPASMAKHGRIIHQLFTQFHASIYLRLVVFTLQPITCLLPAALFGVLGTWQSLLNDLLGTDAISLVL